MTTKQKAILEDLREMLRSGRSAIYGGLKQLSEDRAPGLGVQASYYQRTAAAYSQSWGPLSPWWQGLVAEQPLHGTRTPLTMKGQFLPNEDELIIAHVRAQAGPDGLLGPGVFRALEPKLWRSTSRMAGRYAILRAAHPDLPAIAPGSAAGQQHERAVATRRAILEAGLEAVACGSDPEDQAQTWVSCLAEKLGLTADCVWVNWRSLNLVGLVRRQVLAATRGQEVLSEESVPVEAEVAEAAPNASRLRSPDDGLERLHGIVEKTLRRVEDLAHLLELCREELGQGVTANTARLQEQRRLLDALHQVWVES